MNNQRIAARFTEIADQLELAGTNPFRVRAYRRAASSLERLKDDVALISQKGYLQKIPGIGQELSQKIQQFLTLGRIPDPSLDEESSSENHHELSPSLLSLISMKALDRNAANFIHRRFYMENLEDLEKLVASRLLRILPNIGPQSEKKLILGIEHLRSNEKKHGEHQ